eukprot:TRINITY_DN9843_c0_g1_i2.p1 TRINITY_DN9843_c0_g1~~TRINITY_DN9843_c0_g1_i2.p1  ORF type:complete len:225 (+),score=78.31 TRINITY_DN9843_c0_g1_i2:186-860(+)
MVYSLDHAEFSGDIVKCISEALTLKETPAATKVARLYLVSDILHNSSAPVKNASSYRSGFEAVLRPIMKSFREVYQEQGRMSAQTLREEVLKVLEVWERWSLYPSHVITELVAIFEGKELPKRDGGIDGGPLDDIDGVPIDLDGEAMDMDEPVGLTEAELDGEPLATGSNLEPDLRLLPKNELQNLCAQQGMSIEGTRTDLLDRIVSIDTAALVDNCSKRAKTS